MSRLWKGKIPWCVIRSPQVFIEHTLCARHGPMQGGLGGERRPGKALPRTSKPRSKDACSLASQREVWRHGCGNSTCKGPEEGRSMAHAKN